MSDPVRVQCDGCDTIVTVPRSSYFGWFWCEDCCEEERPGPDDLPEIGWAADDIRWAPLANERP